MWDYKAAADPSWVRVDELSGTKIDTYMRYIIKPSACTTSLAVTPFSSTNPPLAISRPYQISTNIPLIFYATP